MVICRKWRSATTAMNRFLLLVILSITHPLTSVQSIDRCDVSTVLVPNANVMGGSLSSAGSNVTECEIVCSEMTSCLGFDWSTEYSECYLVTSDVDSINYNVSGVDHYNVIRDINHCIGACSNPRWVPIINTHGFGGRALEGTTGLTDCAKRCAQDSSCSAFDWDPLNPDGKRCWIINSLTPTSPAPGIFHYDKICTPISTTGPTNSVITSTSRTSSTTTPTTMLSALSTTRTSFSATSSTRTTVPSGSTLASSSSSTGIGGSTTSTVSATTGTVHNATSNDTINSNSTTPTLVATPTIDADSAAQGQGQTEYDPMAIKPVYVVLAGLGGGCLLLVLTAVIILCQYPLGGEDDGMLKGGFIPYQINSTSSSTNEIVDMELFVVEPNPEFRSSGVIATEFEVASLN